MKKLNTILIIFLSIIILTTSVMGVAVSSDLDEWRYPEENNFNTPTDLNNEEYGHYDLGIELKASVGGGTSHLTPIVSNLNPTLATNDMSIIIIEQHSLVIYDDQLNVIEEYVLPDETFFNPIVKNYNGTSYIIVTTKTTDTVMIFTFNQTSKRLNLENSSVSTEEFGTNFACIDTYSNEALNDYCIAMNDNGSKLIFYDLDDYSFWYDNTPLEISSIEYPYLRQGLNPAIGDMDRDGYPNIFFTGRDEHNAYVYNHEINREMGIYEPEEFFGTDGIGTYFYESDRDSISGTSDRIISSPKLGNLEGGNLELIFALTNNGYNAASNMYPDTGFYNSIIGSGGTDVLNRVSASSLKTLGDVYVTDSEFCNFDSAYDSVCYSSITRVGEDYINCIDIYGYSIIYTDDFGGEFTCKDLDNDGSDEVVIIGKSGQYSGGGFTNSLRAYSNDDDSLVSSDFTLLFDVELGTDVVSNYDEVMPFDTIVVNDLDFDNEVDILISGINGTRLYKSSFSNYLPEWDYKANGGIYGYYSTACVNTTNRFYVKEDQQDPSDYSYTNDGNTDIEELCLILVNGTYSCGSASSFNPYYDLYHDETGIFTYTFVMTDDFNQGSYTSEQTINVLVIDGDEDESCNVISDIVATPGDQGSALSTSTETSQTEITRELFQGNDFAMMIAALILIVGMGLGGAKVGSATGMLFGGFMGAFIGVMLGWISAWILVMVLLIIFAIAIVMKVALGSVPNGGV